VDVATMKKEGVATVKKVDAATLIVTKEKFKVLTNL